LGKLRADFRKRTECATLLARERYSDYREILLNAGGWQTMKPARSDRTLKNRHLKR
jgi:hypothetical protein